MQRGFENEMKFAKEFDNKQIYKLSLAFKEIIYAIFKDINRSDYIECWQSKYYEKADIKIRIKNEIKGISIKSRKYCSMHQETTHILFFFKKNWH